MTNRLAGSTSPYLLQHQHNPVDWYPWGEEASLRKVEDKPIFLSIGYSACHWCHVMEHESFENEAIAALMNQNFVAIKVDREQRPDLDQIYMQAIQMMTGSGGWPMSVFLTPEAKPFYGGTYWPPENRYGRPGFGQVLTSVADAWRNKRPEIEQQCEEMVGHLQQSLAENSSANSTDSLSDSLFVGADRWLHQAFDAKFGGFGQAPKFPHAMDLMLLMRIQTRQPTKERLRIITHTLDCMAAGGIYDHLGGGFSRYSVDERWLVPHFEKMLYDNGLLASTYLDAFLLTRDTRYRTLVCETLDYILREMTDPAGGFYSAEDADSEGVEGKFYVWSKSDIESILGAERAKIFCSAYDVTASGNFEGHNILNLAQPLERSARELGFDAQHLESQLAEDRLRLLQVRSERIHPGLDDKVLVAWNALMIDAMARAGVALAEPRYLAAAQKCASFLLDQMRTEQGRLLHVWRRGKGEIEAYLDDYACMVHSLITLFEADGCVIWIQHALSLVAILNKHFADGNGGFYFTADDSEILITRTKDIVDHSVPSGNAMAATALLRLCDLTGNSELRTIAERTLNCARNLMTRSPAAAGQMLIALDWLWGPTRQLVVICRDEVTRRQLSQHLASKYMPRTMLAVVTCESISTTPSNTIEALFQNRSLPDNELAILYDCEGSTCQTPICGIESILEIFE